MKIFAFVLAIFFVVNALDVKHLGGGPEEFSLHSLPDPKNTVTVERSYTENVWFKEPGADQVVYTTNFPVDGPTEFEFSFASPHAQSLSLELVDPTGKPVDLASAATESFWPVGDEKLPITVYTIKQSQKGVYKLTIKSNMEPAKMKQIVATSTYPNAALMLINNDYVEIHSHLTSYTIKAGQPIGVVSQIIDATTGVSPTNIQVTSANLDILKPDGSELEIPMKDDVDFLRAPPQSGVFGAQINANEAGDYVFLSKLQGFFQDSTLGETVAFERTTQHFVSVSAATIELDGTARLRPLDSERVNIDIGVTNSDNQPNLRGYAEVWGIDPSTKTLVPAAWIGGVVTPAQNYVTLQLNTKWLQLAGVTGPLVLNNVYLADMDTNYAVTQVGNKIPVLNSQLKGLKLHHTMRKMAITNEMKFGVLPPKPNNTLAIDGALVLLHGYCAGNNPWKATSSAFTGAYYFEDSRANLSHDQFSKKVVTYVGANNIGSFSVIGHSQGGTVGAHISNYYVSGLDYTTTGQRPIQSVGTPYKGCTAAGSAANLGKIFGVGCGANSDLTVDGSTVWLAGISSATRSKIYYYTTTYEQGKLFGDWCNIAVNLLLAWPNDGVTELEYAFLPGGNGMGNTQKQCHTDSMSYPAQYHDLNRNKQMNAAAAR